MLLTPSQLMIRLGNESSELIVLAADMGDDSLPDLTPLQKDSAILDFRSKLCCNINSIALINENRVCAACFDVLRDKYIGDHWDIV
jgi:hypothetical protein